MDEPDDSRLKLPLALLLFLIALGGTIDLWLDRPAEWLSFHVIYEIALVAGAIGTAVWLWTGWRRAEHEGIELRRSLSERQAERDAWRASAEQALAGLGQAIERQFDSWGFTPAERDVSLQVLKGRSHKEIAAETGRSERTVRQHAAAAYRKAGLEGRAALAGFFLEGLRSPSADPGPAAEAGSDQ
jgi:DNA-binding CsgD family transcriptional regulator